MSDAKLTRIYGEREIGKILKRATELQHREPTAPAAGVTLAELEEIAAEAGIDPSFLRRAAIELDVGAGDVSVWTKMAGAELVLIREIELDGELPEVGFERIVAAVQMQSREHGQPSLLGRTLTWRADSPNKTRTLQLLVSVRDGRTRIRFEENLRQLAAGVFGGGLGGFGVGIGLGVGLPIGIEVLGSALFATAAPLGIFGLCYVGARAIYRGMVERRRRAVSDLFERVVEEARAAIAEGVGPDGVRVSEHDPAASVESVRRPEPLGPGTTTA